MKTLGPYLASRTLREGPIRILRGLDRLTGVPVVLYVLPGALEAPPAPPAPLLGYTDVGEEAGEAFVVAALPPASVPAPGGETTARGALEALAVLHERGLVHGGLSPAQLWATGSGVLVSGAGLPWSGPGEGFEPPEGGGPSPAADLYALGQSLQALGGIPPALAGLLDPDPRTRPSAREALALLDAPPASRAPVAPAPAVRVEAAPDPSPARVEAPARVPEAVPPRPEVTFAPIEATFAPPAVPAAPVASPREVAVPVVAPVEEAPVEEAPVESLPAEPPPVEPPPPVERRGTDISHLLGGPFREPSAPARDAAPTVEAPPPPPIAPPPAAPPPEAPSPVAFEWTPRAPEPEPPTPAPVFEPRPAFGPLPDEGVVVVRAATGAPLPAPKAATTPIERPPVPDPVNPRAQPVRIGWEEDHSWRVVKAVPDSPRVLALPERLWRRLDRRALLLPGVAALVLAGAGGAYLAWRSGADPAVSACCTVQFTVRGSAVTRAKLSVLEGPPGGPLKRGEPLGVAPGPVRFPNVPGTYRLRVAADGYDPATLVITVPQSKTAVIDLGR